MTPSASASCRRKPTFGVLQLQASRRKTKQVRARKVTGGEILKLQAPLAQRLAPQARSLPFFSRSNARNKAGVCSANFFTRLRSGMDALQKVVEGKSTTDRNDNFAIKDEAFFAQRQCGGNHFRKIAAQILARLRIHGHRVGIPRQEATEAVPFGLVLPLFACRE